MMLVLQLALCIIRNSIVARECRMRDKDWLQGGLLLQVVVLVVGQQGRGRVVRWGGGQDV